GRIIEDLAAAVDRGATRVLAVDIASGLSSDRGEVAGPVATAEVTVTFAAPKHGHVWPPGCDATGALVGADLGIPRDVLGAMGASVWLIEAEDAARAWPPRTPSSHKGAFEHLPALARSSRQI